MLRYLPRYVSKLAPICISVIASCLCARALAQNDSDLIRAVAANYHSLPSFEISGELQADIPGSQWKLRIRTDDAAAGPAFVPAQSPFLKYGEVLRFAAVTVTDSAGNPAPPNSLNTNVGMPGRSGHFERIADDVVSQKQLPDEPLRYNGSTIQCKVLEITYNRERWKPEEQTVRYWIDPKRLLVMKEEFVEWQRGRGGTFTLWYWVYTVDTVKANEPPPKWLVDSATHGDAPITRTEWIGKQAPDFQLSDLHDHEMRLSNLKGRVVLLDFWGTYCRPCREEMPTVEKIAAAYHGQGLQAWTISSEESSVLNKWSLEKHPRLPILVDTDGKVEDRFEVHGIPALVVIGRDGKILSYHEGTQSEQSLRSIIDGALGEAATNKN